MSLKEQRIAEVEKLLEDPAVWQEQEKGTVLSQELTELKKEIGEVRLLKEKLTDVKLQRDVWGKR
ncbi:PCRF domain-containing protein [Patescibacteria group bacterium]|nr:PCRF domain-containing protein [Patescibacteria group bacterium]